LDRIKNGNVLPYGEQLKNLLWDSTISESDLRKVLRGRGVFASCHDKKEMIPLLTTSILSSKEFEALREMYVFKRETPKQRSSPLSIVGDVNFSDLLPDEVNPQLLIDEDFMSFSIVGIPSFEFIGDKNNGVLLQYEVEHVDPSKNWFHEKSRSKGEVRFEKISGADYKIIKKHTSKETERVNNEIVKFVSKKLKESGKVAPDQRGNEILFNKFSHAERISYFVEILNYRSKVFVFQKITDIDIKPAEGVSLPDNTELKWMEDRINKLRLHGKSLEDTFFIKEKKYHSYLLFPKLEAEYLYDTAEASVTCSVCLNFSDYPKNNEAELEVIVTVKGLTPKVDRANINRTRDQLLDEFDKIKMELFLAYLAAKAGI
jgi:hypothetical protein